MYDYCAERLGPDLAARLMALARPAFGLVEATSGPAAGHSRFGGQALLEPGTPWPSCEDFPLSLLAVIDTDALAPWLDSVLPAGTGLLNFFYLDRDSEQADPASYELAARLKHNDPRLGRVVVARSAHAIEATPPVGASEFTPVAWEATPGFTFPDTYDEDWKTLDLGPDVDDVYLEMPDVYIEEQLTDWGLVPGLILTENIAFGHPFFPTGSSLTMPDGAEPTRYRHLLQLSGNDEWRIGGDGGWMHWSIPTEALRAGDFGRAVPTPDIW